MAKSRDLPQNGRSGCETMQKLRRWCACVKMAMSDSELLPLEGAISGIWRFCFSVKDAQFVEKNKMNEVANMQMFPGAQVCVEYSQHVVSFADSPPP